MGFREYEIEINGLPHTFQIKEGEPIPAGAKLVENKQRQPANKSRKPNNKTEG